MKHLLWTFCFIGLLINCSNENVDNDRTNVAVTPAQEITNKTSVRLKAENTGSVQLMDFTVTLDTTEDINLLKYDGPAEVTAHSFTLKSNSFPCAINITSFKCSAQLTTNNINIQNCNIAGHSFNIQVSLLHGEQAKAPYSIIGIQVTNPTGSCYRL